MTDTIEAKTADAKVSPNMTTESSMKTESGNESSRGTAIVGHPLSFSAATLCALSSDVGRLA